MTNYWEDETPVTVVTNRNVLQLYKAAERLQISLPEWTDKDGNERRGKYVTLNITELVESDAATMRAALDVFSFIIELINEKLAGSG